MDSPDEAGFAVLDVETTGLSPARDRIVEIAVVRTDAAGRTVDEWSTLVDPQRSVGASHIHGITSDDVRRAPRFDQLVGELMARLAGHALVAHNAVFDLKFLRHECARAGVDLPEAPYLCTLEASWDYLPHLSRRRLPDCCYACGVRLDDAHSALGDARATAGLLAAYLDPRTGRPPRAAHTRLPAAAAGVAWPRPARAPVSLLPRGGRPAPPAPAAPGALATWVEDLPLGSAQDDGAPAEAAVYVELLAEVFDDGVLTDAEVAALAEVADLYSLGRGQVTAAHRGFLLALARRAVEDGTITRAERAELVGAARVLGLDPATVRSVLDEAHGIRIAELSAGLAPLPEGWRYGPPLRVGQRVAFTGCDELDRSRLEAAARRAGLTVTGAVSRLTAVLVTDGANPHTAKAVAARELGTRVVDPDTFGRLLRHIQPPEPDGHAGPAGAAETVSRARAGGDPADLRAWARQHGFAVGSRGRMPAEVVAAYHHARRPSAGSEG